MESYSDEDCWSDPDQQQFYIYLREKYGVTRANQFAYKTFHEEEEEEEDVSEELFSEEEVSSEEVSTEDDELSEEIVSPPFKKRKLH